MADLNSLSDVFIDEPLLYDGAGLVFVVNDVTDVCRWEITPQPIAVKSDIVLKPGDLTEHGGKFLQVNQSGTELEFIEKLSVAGENITGIINRNNFPEDVVVPDHKQVPHSGQGFLKRGAGEGAFPRFVELTENDMPPGVARRSDVAISLDDLEGHVCKLVWVDDEGRVDFLPLADLPTADLQLEKRFLPVKQPAGVLKSTGETTLFSELEADDIPDLDAAKITSGVLDIAQLPAGLVSAADVANVLRRDSVRGDFPTAIVWDDEIDDYIDNRIPENRRMPPADSLGPNDYGVLVKNADSYNGAGNIVSIGAIGFRRDIPASIIPNIDASKTTTGVFEDERIPATVQRKTDDISADRIIGTVNSARLALDAGDIPDLPAAKIVSGELDKARLPSDAVFDADIANVLRSNTAETSFPSFLARQNALTSLTTTVGNIERLPGSGTGFLKRVGSNISYAGLADGDIPVGIERKSATAGKLHTETDIKGFFKRYAWDGSTLIATGDIGDNQVTADKLADSINTAIAGKIDASDVKGFAKSGSVKIVATDLDDEVENRLLPATGTISDSLISSNIARASALTGLLDADNLPTDVTKYPAGLRNTNVDLSGKQDTSTALTTLLGLFVAGNNDRVIGIRNGVPAAVMDQQGSGGGGTGNLNFPSAAIVAGDVADGDELLLHDIDGAVEHKALTIANLKTKLDVPAIETGASLVTKLEGQDVGSRLSYSKLDDVPDITPPADVVLKTTDLAGQADKLVRVNEDADDVEFFDDYARPHISNFAIPGLPSPGDITAGTTAISSIAFTASVANVENVNQLIALQFRKRPYNMGWSNWVDESGNVPVLDYLDLTKSVRSETLAAGAHYQWRLAVWDTAGIRHASNVVELKVPRDASTQPMLTAFWGTSATENDLPSTTSAYASLAAFNTAFSNPGSKDVSETGTAFDAFIDEVANGHFYWLLTPANRTPRTVSPELGGDQLKQFTTDEGDMVAIGSDNYRLHYRRNSSGGPIRYRYSVVTH